MEKTSSAQSTLQHLPFASGVSAHSPSTRVQLRMSSNGSSAQKVPENILREEPQTVQQTTLKEIIMAKVREG